MRLDNLIRDLADESRWLFGEVPATARLVNGWTDKLPTILAWGDGQLSWQTTGGLVCPELTLRRGEAAEEDWTGDLVVWPDTDDRVVVRRVHFYDDGLVDVTLAAARSAEVIARFVAQVTALWRRWRREQEPVVGREWHPVKWSDLILPAALLEDVRTTVEAFAVARERYRTWQMPYKRGLLFHGAPGNGKTHLCRAIVSALGWPVVWMENNHAQSVRHAFASARELAPAVLLVEDVDSLFDKDDLSTFLNQLDGFESVEGVLVLATTNHPETLDPALTSRPSRFDRVYAVQDPDVDQRERYLGRLFAQSQLDPTQIAWLAAETDGMSMAFLKEVFLGAALRASARGVDLPTFEDAQRALPALASHRKAAERHFATARASGFVR